MQSVAIAFPAVCFSHGVTNYLCKAITGAAPRLFIFALDSVTVTPILTPAICLSFTSLLPPSILPLLLCTDSVISNYVLLLPSLFILFFMSFYPDTKVGQHRDISWQWRQSQATWSFSQAVYSQKGQVHAGLLRRIRWKRVGVSPASTLLFPPPEACQCHFCSLSSLRWGVKAAFLQRASKVHDVVEVDDYIFFASKVDQHVSNPPPPKKTGHIVQQLMLQNGNCEFGANDSGWQSSEQKMEIRCGTNRAWSILHSSPGSLTHTHVRPAGTPFCAFFWLQVPRHCGGSKCLMGTNLNPRLLPCPPPIILTLTKRASGRSDRE